MLHPFDSLGASSLGRPDFKQALTSAVVYNDVIISVAPGSKQGCDPTLI